MIRKVIAYKDNFIKFYRNQDPKTQKKIEFVLDLVRFERQVPKKFYKLLENTNGIWEVRVITTFKSIRILCFQDKGELVVLTNCFLKKKAENTKTGNQKSGEIEKRVHD
jgi:hypothetical protein